MHRPSARPCQQRQIEVVVDDAMILVNHPHAAGLGAAREKPVALHQTALAVAQRQCALHTNQMYG